jgi:hypothetical protein
MAMSHSEETWPVGLRITESRERDLKSVRTIVSSIRTIRASLKDAIRQGKGEITFKTPTQEMPDRPREVRAKEVTNLRLKD